MVTEARKKRNIKETAKDSYYYKAYNTMPSSLTAIERDGDFFEVRSTSNSELYERYLKRKEIDVDFSGAGNLDDIARMRDECAKKFENAQRKADITATKKEYGVARKKQFDGYDAKNLAYHVLQDLHNAGSDKKISDERYQNIVQYAKNVLTAVADGKDVSKIEEPNLSGLKRFTSRITGEDSLKNTKKMINGMRTGKRLLSSELSDTYGEQNTTSKEVILSVLERMPEERVTSWDEAYEKFMTPFENDNSKNMHEANEKYHKLGSMLMENKIKEDGLKTFDELAKQHMIQLEKDRILARKADFMEVLGHADSAKGKARQRVANINGSVDPVARSIAKIRKKDAKRKAQENKVDENKEKSSDTQVLKAQSLKNTKEIYSKER